MFIADWRQLRKTVSNRSTRAFRPGTQANVRSHVLLYVAFADHFGLRDFPATARTLTSFGEFLLRSFRAPKSAFNALASLRHFHLDFKLPTLAFEARQFMLWRRAVASTVRHVPRAAPPLAGGELRCICRVAGSLGPLGQLFAALASVLYFTMARLSSLLTGKEGGFDHTRLPTWGDLRCDSSGWALRIKWAKAHQAADQGYWVPLLPIQGAPECPVANLARLRAVTEGVSADTPLFALPTSQRGGKGGRPCRALTMRVAREWLRVLLARAGLGNKGFTFHSFRRGACTQAFRNGAEVADIQQLGGWRSDAVRLYLPLEEARRRAAKALNG